jgi:DNA-binding response OmpR family regulator
MTTKKTVILVVDDDAQIVRLVTHALQAEGYAVLTASDGQQALYLVETNDIDLLLLDLLLPKRSGFEVCEQIRTYSPLPIIVLTARGQVVDKLRAFELGADDYVTKPFHVVELLARVRAVLRRAQWSVNGQGRHLSREMTIRGLIVDDARHQVTVDGRLIALTPTEYRLLVSLVQNAGLVMTFDQLLEQVWGVDYVGEGHLLSVNMHRLRTKLEPDPAHPTYILTKPGFGYLLPVPAPGAAMKAESPSRKQLMPSVLIVDDDEEIRASLRLVLEDEGYTVAEAPHGGEALTLLRRRSERRVVLLDQLMPVLDGTGVLRTLQAEPALAQQHTFVLVTALRPLPLQTRVLATSLGVPVLKKPFELDRLLTLVAQQAKRLEDPSPER